METTMAEDTKEKLHVMLDSGLIHYFPGDDMQQPPILLGRLVIAAPPGPHRGPDGEENPETDRMMGNLNPAIFASGYGNIALHPYNFTVRQANAHNAALEDVVLTGMEVANVGDQIALTYRPPHGGEPASVKYGQSTVANRLRYIKGGKVGFQRFGRTWEGKLTQRGQPENLTFTCVVVNPE